jgi:hypothetical protein
MTATVEQRTMAAVTQAEVDLEKGLPLRVITSSIPSPKTRQVTIPQINTNGTPKPTPRRRNSRKPTVNFDRSDSPVASEKPIDPQRIITNCNCEGSKDLTILPFFLPTDLGLSRFNKGLLPLSLDRG